MLYASALISAGDSARATRLLREHMRDKDKDPNVYQLYARATGNVGQQAEAHRALAEYYYLIGETGTAVQQLTLAQNLLKDQEKDFYLAARVEARLSELKKELAASTKR